MAQIEDLKYWDLVPTPEPNCEIECSECKKWSSHTEWPEGIVYCEICGEHDSIVCPSCGHHFDHVFRSELKTRPGTKSTVNDSDDDAISYALAV